MFIFFRTHPSGTNGDTNNTIQSAGRMMCKSKKIYTLLRYLIQPSQLMSEMITWGLLPFHLISELLFQTAEQKNLLAHDSHDGENPLTVG